MFKQNSWCRFIEKNIILNNHIKSKMIIRQLKQNVTFYMNLVIPN